MRDDVHLVLEFTQKWLAAVHPRCTCFMRLGVVMPNRLVRPSPHWPGRGPLQPEPTPISPCGPLSPPSVSQLERAPCRYAISLGANDRGDALLYRCTLVIPTSTALLQLLGTLSNEAMLS